MPHPNYIEDVNRFHLAGPPAWFLRKLLDFDNSLVIVPSRQACVYRLGQRRKLKLPEQLVNDALFNESDTKMMASYSLVPVTSIIATVNWADPALFSELHNRAPHRLGGADRVNQMLDEEDNRDDLKRQFKQDDMLNYLAKDAWGLYNKKIGVRSHMYVPRTRQEVVGSKSPAMRIR